MMRSIDLDVESAVATRNAGNGCELGDLAAGLDACGMNGIGCIWREACLAVLDAGVEFAGDVLVECAAKTDIQALAAVANCQDGFAARKCVLEDCKISFLPVRVGVVRLFMARRAVEGGINIGRGTRENKGVKIFDLGGQGTR